HGVIQSRKREAFSKGPALIVERVARQCAAHHEGRKSALPLSHVRKVPLLSDSSFAKWPSRARPIDLQSRCYRWLETFRHFERRRNSEGGNYDCGPAASPAVARALAAEAGPFTLGQFEIGPERKSGELSR